MTVDELANILSKMLADNKGGYNVCVFYYDVGGYKIDDFNEELYIEINQRYTDNNVITAKELSGVIYQMVKDNKGNYEVASDDFGDINDCEIDNSSKILQLKNCY